MGDTATEETSVAKDATTSETAVSHHVQGTALLALTDEQRKLLGDEPPVFSVEEEVKAVEQILEGLTDEEKAEMGGENLPIRVYRRKADVDQSVAAITATLAWRKEFCLEAVRQALPKTPESDSELSETILRENEKGALYARGYDREGRCLLYLRPSLRREPYDEIGCQKAIVWNIEKTLACTARKSSELSGQQKELETLHMLVDYHDFSWFTVPPMASIKTLLELLQTHYMGRTRYVFILHPPFLFWAFWEVVQYFLSEAVRSKIIFVDDSNIEESLWCHFDNKDDMLETCAGGELEREDFDAEVYHSLPLNVAFGESSDPASEHKEE